MIEESKIERKEIETYWGHCTFSTSHPNEPPWHLEFVEGKGYLAIANRTFRAGDLICREKPITWCRGWHPFTEEQIHEIEMAVNLLDPFERKAFYDMANVFPDVNECAGIYMTNSFDMVGAEVPSCGMYLVCVTPFSFDPLLNNFREGNRPVESLLCSQCPTNSSTRDSRRGQFCFFLNLPSSPLSPQVLIASRDIERGDEINDCYIELRQSTRERREKLQAIYRFHCECVACQDFDLSILNQLTLGDSALPTQPFPPDLARERAFHLDQQILLLAESGLSPCEEILAFAQELLTLLSSSSCEGWKERFLGESNLSIYHLALTLSELEGESPDLLRRKRKVPKRNKLYKLAMKHLVAAHHWHVLLQGGESPDSSITRSYSQLHQCLQEEFGAKDEKSC
jgi:hypothetical protein